MEQLPPQETGRQTDFTHERKFDNLAAAHHAFQAAAGRLLSVNNWHYYSGAGCAKFTLCNNQGTEVEVMAEEGFFISIDLPAPGPDAGDGLEWVMIEKPGFGGQCKYGRRVGINDGTPGARSAETGYGDRAFL